MASSARAAPGLCRFIFSADLALLVRCRIDRLLPQAHAEELIGDEPLDVEVDLVLDGEVFRTAQSSQGVFDASPEHGAFRPQAFVFAIKVRDLPRHCSFIVRLRARSGDVYRGVLPLFNRRAVLRQGPQLLALMKLPDATAAELAADEHRDACAGPDWTLHTNEVVLQDASAQLREALRLSTAIDLHDRNCLAPAVPGFEGSEEFFKRLAIEGIEASGMCWMSVVLPVFQHPVIFSETQYGQELEVPVGVLAPSLGDELEHGHGGAILALQSAAWLMRPLRPIDDRDTGAKRFKCFVDHDAEAQQKHPAALKSQRLTRSARLSRTKDRDARPNADELRRLNELIRRPRRQFNPEEKDLLLRFRWSLTDQPGALTKFLHAVDWKDFEERQHAIEMLGHWSPVDIDDALELLGREFKHSREVRRHAVERLERASDEDLQLYLLQLVQALRYEPAAHELVGGKEEDGAPPATSGADAAAQHAQTLTAFLISRAVRSQTLATKFHWYLVAETEDQLQGAMFDRICLQFSEALDASAEGQAVKAMIQAQEALRKQLLWCVKCAKAMKRERIQKKVETLRQALAAEMPDERRSEVVLNLAGGLGEGIPLPVDPSVSLLRVLPEQCFLLKSAMVPAVLTCEVRHTGEGPNGKKELKKIMVKEGDDLRQDQLVLQLIILMDSILKKYGLDLQLTPYQVIAQSTNDGQVEFVPDASNISSILKDHNNDIQQFFRAHHPQPNTGDDAELAPHNSYGIQPWVLENFIRSSAGYCVITYILGIGDRHLDNLMVSRDGKLFHIDFGFILGKDPKPFPPPMRICKEMVEGMGGNNSPGYQSFKSKCCQAYKILRRHAKLIINLLYLMTDSGIKDLTDQFAILKVEQKFQALMDDEQAEEYFLNLIDESVSALFPVINEMFHKMAVAIK